MKTLILFIIVMLLCLYGCNILQPSQPVGPSISPADNIGTVIGGVKSSMNWVVLLSVLGVGAGVFATANGMKVGMAAIAGSVAALFMGLAVVRHSNIMAIGGLVGASLLCLASILHKNTALAEIIKSVQRVRITEPDKDGITSTLEAHQSPATQKLVRATKAKLKLNGEI